MLDKTHMAVYTFIVGKARVFNSKRTPLTDVSKDHEVALEALILRCLAGQGAPVLLGLQPSIVVPSAQFRPLRFLFSITVIKTMI